MNDINTSDTISYLQYWRERQKKQRDYNQSLAYSAREQLEPIIDYLKENFPVTKIILFGSLVKGKFCETSDIDLAVDGIPPEKYFQVLNTVNSMSDRLIDLKPLEALEAHFLKRVLETGEVLYASDLKQ
jgi:predicted nucleotidyltransferase